MENKYPQCGSDEVGTGDTFGPVVVACALLEEKDLELINELNIRDSKELTDSQIEYIASRLIKQVKYSYCILKNDKYNKVHEKYNLNAIKAILHNEVYLKLETKYKLPKLCVVDQFCTKDLYYGYLESIKKIKRDLKFETKAENKYPSVAVASIIARYYFIKEMSNLSNKYNIELAKGSSNPILTKQLKEIIKKYGKDELNNVAKLHFKNVKNILNSI